MSSQIPQEVLQRLRELEKELQDGDITSQGFEKKKAKLLAPYVTPQENGAEPPAPRANSYTQQDHAESAARAIAVQAALAGREGRGKEAPMASRRTAPNTVEGPTAPPTSSPPLSSNPPPPPPQGQAVLSPSTSNTSIDSDEKGGRVLSSTPTRQPSGKGSPPPTAPKKTPKAPVQQPSTGRVEPLMTDRETAIGVGDSAGKNGAVSHKIQQLLNTLKRPKKHRGPVEELYQEESNSQVPEDASAPKPMRPMMQPVVGTPPESRQDWHRNLDAALQHYSGLQGGKLPAISMVDAHGKVSLAATYGKLHIRAMKVAYYMLNKLGGGRLVSPGTTVALVFRNDEANAFATAFYGCILAGVIPVALEPPLTREDPGGQQVGFLLGSLNISVALTSELTAKNLPKEEGKEHIVHFKGWPRLTWFLTEHLPKPPKDWVVPQRPTPDSPAYIEYSLAKDGSALGVVVSRSALLMHCRSLSTACMYKEGEVLLCTEDPKNSIGLWHGVMTAVYCGLHVIYIPPSVVATLPLCWLQVLHKHNASCVLSSSHRLGMCVQLSNNRELRDVSLQSLRILLLEDGANPWSLASSDLFYEAFSAKGLAREALCPCAGSPETLTVSLRRPSASTTTGRGVMSISGLSYGVVRTEEADSITSLTLQDVGLVMPGARIAVVKSGGAPVLCKADEVGEICVQSPATGSVYWGLQGKSANTFKVQPLDEKNSPIGSGPYVRSGLLGFVTDGGLVFICGTQDGLIHIGGRRHNTEDLIATILAVEPHSFVHKHALAVFSVAVLKQERVVLVAEQRHNCTDEQAFTWMNSVVPAIESIHGINLYGLVLVKPEHLPRDSSGRVLVHETKQRFLDGQLHPENLLMCPYQCVSNLPTAKAHSSPMNNAKIIGDLVTGRVGSSVTSGSQVQALECDPAAKMDFIADVLRWSAQENPDNKLYTLIDAKGHVAKTMTSQQLHKRAERLASFIQDKLKLNSGDHVALIYPAGLDLVCAFYACLYIGIVPVLIQPPNLAGSSSNLPTIKIILEVSNSRAILTLHTVARLLKSKEAAAVLDPKTFPPLLETDDTSSKKLEKFYKAPTTELIAYLDFSVSTTGILSGVKISHQAVLSMCRAHKAVGDLHPTREVALCLDPYSGLSLVLWILSGVYSGHHTYLVCPPDVEVNPLLWLSVVSENKVQDILCSYSAVDLCCRELGNDVESLKTKGISLSCVQTCVVVSEERPRQALITSFSTLLSHLGLSAPVTASFGCRVNPLVALQGAHQPEASIVYVDQRALRVDRVSLLERGAPYSVGIMECAKVAPGVQVAIVNPETKMACAVTDLGEIWASSLHNGSGYYGLKDEDNDTLSREHFRAVLAGGGDTTISFARTGYLGFVKKSEKPDKNGVVQDSLIVVGALDEALIIRGARYHPSDIEVTIVRCSRSIVSSAVFTSNNLLVVVAELKGEDSEALDIVPLITTALLEEQQLIAGIVVVADPGTIPINTRGEKQRVHLKDLFLADQIDPIYVAYNL